MLFECINPTSGAWRSEAVACVIQEPLWPQPPHARCAVEEAEGNLLQCFCSASRLQRSVTRNSEGALPPAQFGLRPAGPKARSFGSAVAIRPPQQSCLLTAGQLAQINRLFNVVRRAREALSQTGQAAQMAARLTATSTAPCKGHATREYNLAWKLMVLGAIAPADRTHVLDMSMF